MDIDMETMIARKRTRQILRGYCKGRYISIERRWREVNEMDIYSYIREECVICINHIPIEVGTAMQTHCSAVKVKGREDNITYVHTYDQCTVYIYHS